MNNFNNEPNNELNSIDFEPNKKSFNTAEEIDGEIERLVSESTRANREIAEAEKAGDMRKVEILKNILDGLTAEKVELQEKKRKFGVWDNINAPESRGER